MLCGPAPSRGHGSRGRILVAFGRPFRWPSVGLAVASDPAHCRFRDGQPPAGSGRAAAINDTNALTALVTSVFTTVWSNSGSAANSSRAAASRAADRRVVLGAPADQPALQFGQRGRRQEQQDGFVAQTWRGPDLAGALDLDLQQYVGPGGQSLLDRLARGAVAVAGERRVLQQSTVGGHRLELGVADEPIADPVHLPGPGRAGRHRHRVPEIGQGRPQPREDGALTHPRRSGQHEQPTPTLRSGSPALARWVPSSDDRRALVSPLTRAASGARPVSDRVSISNRTRPATPGAAARRGLERAGSARCRTAP